MPLPKSNDTRRGGETSVISDFRHAPLILDKIRVMKLPRETSNTVRSARR